MMATIGNLSPELLVEIFSYYVQSEGHEAFSRNIPRVCRDWDVHSSTVSLWRDVKVHNANYLLNVSRRGLLYHTERLKFDYYVKGFFGMDISAVFENIRDLKELDLAGNTVCNEAITVLTENCPHLERLCLHIMEHSDTMPRELDQFLALCGPTLKHLELVTVLFSPEAGLQLVSGIAAKCPLLEALVFTPKHEMTPFPIHELRRGCPRLRELEFCGCSLITAGRSDSLLCRGFEVLKKFRARNSDFGGLDVESLLKDSTDLEHLKLCYNDDLVFGNISNIPSDNMRFLSIGLKDPGENFVEALQDAVRKWRRTLSVLYLDGWKRDITHVLELLLEDNPNPQLKSLTIGENVDPHFFEEFVQHCRNLIRLQMNGKYYYGRERIEEASIFLKTGM